MCSNAKCLCKSIVYWSLSITICFFSPASDYSRADAGRFAPTRAVLPVGTELVTLSLACRESAKTNSVDASSHECTRSFFCLVFSSDRDSLTWTIRCFISVSVAGVKQTRPAVSIPVNC